jgi:hypothetical protein
MDEEAKAKSEHDGYLPNDVAEELTSKYGEVLAVRVAAGTVVFRRPKRSEHMRYTAKAADPTTRTNAYEQLARDCCVWPGPQVLEVWFEKYPALSTTFANEILPFAGLEENPATRKY